MWVILTQMSLWSEFGPWLNGIYPPAEMFIPFFLHILAIVFIFWFILELYGPLSPFLSIAGSLIPKEEKKADIFLIRTYSFMLPIRMT